MTECENLFFELVQVALGNRTSLNKCPTNEEWKAMLATAQKQAVAGFVFDVLELLSNQGQKPPSGVLFEWIGIAERIKQHNYLVNQRCKELETIFVDERFRCCVLKGQGTALYYNNPSCRQCGDIDLWVTIEGKGKREDVRSEVLRFVKRQGYHVGHIDIKHSDIDFFKDVPVEVHFLPSWMYNPATNRKLQKYFEEQAEKQFLNYDAEAGFTHTTVDFDVVFSLVHIYRHVFDEGIGLRQLLDYYHILIHSTPEQRKDALQVLRSLGMGRFAGGVMFVLETCFLLPEDYLLCGIDEKHGQFLLSEILLSGNFGHYDPRLKHQHKRNRFLNGWTNLKRNCRFLNYYPSEVLWSPLWKIWHWCWRKKHGYL